MIRLLLGATALTLAAPAAADPLTDATKAQLPQLMALYRDLHAAPELSLQEVKTSIKLAVPEGRKTLRDGIARIANGRPMRKA